MVRGADRTPLLNGAILHERRFIVQNPPNGAIQRPQPARESDAAYGSRMPVAFHEGSMIRG